MVQFRESPSSKVTDEEWHRFRQRARKTAFSIDQFSDEEVTRFDLETAQIDGSDNPRSFTINRPIDLLGMNGIDLRDLRDR